MADYQSRFTGSEIDSRLEKAGTAVQPAALNNKQDKLVSGTNIKTINGQSILGSGDIPVQGGAPNAVQYVAQELTEEQKAQARANIGAASLAEIEDMDFVTATERPTASASTMGHIYLIGPDANNNYDRYYTQESNGTYSWVSLGSTQLNLSTYATKDEVSQLEAEVTDNTNDIESLQNQLDNYQPIVIEGDVTNAPDEEDITTDENDLLKFANRAAHTNYLGYVILRKGNTFASQVTVPNTIYEIRYNFDLGGEEFEMPSGCVLRFVGGSISNGTITTNPFRVVADNDVSILKGISFDGSYITNDTIFVDWFDFVTDGITDNLASFKRLEVMVNTKGGGNVVFGLNKTYGVLPLVVHKTNVNFTPVHYGLWFEHCNSIDVNLNGSTIKVLGSNTALFGIINFFDCKAKLHDGVLRGDRDVHDYSPYTNYAGNQSTNFELIHNLNQMGGELEIYNIISEYVCGDGILVGSATIWSSGDEYPGTYNVHNCEIRYCGRNGIVCHSAFGIPTVKDTIIHHIGDYDDMPGYAPKAGIDVEFEDGVGAIGDLRFRNLVISECTNRTISTYTNTQVNSFIAEGINSNGCFQVSNINAISGVNEVINSSITETKGTTYLIGGTVFRGCKITFTKVGALLYKTSYYDCEIVTELEDGQSGLVISDGEGDAFFHNCDLSLNRSSLRYYNFDNCRVFLKETGSYTFNGVVAKDTIFKGVLDSDNYTAVVYSGNSISGKSNALNFKNCSFQQLYGSSSAKGINLASTFDGSIFSGCDFDNKVRIQKGSCQVVFSKCTFDGTTFSNTTFSKVMTFEKCTGNLVLGTGNASYRDVIKQCDFTLNQGNWPSINVNQHADIFDSIITDGGSTTTNNSAADFNAKNSIFIFGKNYTSTNMVMEGCNITGITEAQFSGTKKNCVFAVPFATSGATANRPTSSAVGVGFTYFDTDLGKMIVSNGTAWANMDGTAL